MTKLNDYIRTANKSEYIAHFQDFKQNIFIYTLRWEGGGKLHKVEGDSGGWTIWGIAYNHNKHIFDNLDDFKDTTYDEAAAIAFVKYYMSARVDCMNKKARLMYFDMCYNLGTVRTIKIMQECAGVKTDGIIGPMTLSKMSLVTEDCLYHKRNSFYNQLVRQNIKFQKFIKGWLNRSTAIFNVD